MAKAPTLIRSKARAFTDVALRTLAEIMNDRSAPAPARVAAAETLLAYGLGQAVDRKRFALIEPRFYVYSIHRDNRLLYVGKGCGRRHLQSAARLEGKSRVRASFNNEGAALQFERRLIERFKPIANVVYSGPAH